MFNRRLPAIACASLMSAAAAWAGGEAGPITLRDQGFFWVGARPTPVQNARVGFGPPGPGTAIQGQMFVGFDLLARKRHPYPLVLVHGGGGQATDWMGTPDGRDGWLDYFLAALVVITMVTSLQAVGALLAIGLLVAPAATV